MRQYPVYKVAVATAQGSKLTCTFLGRPTQSEVIEAIREARKIRLKENLTDAEREVVWDRYDQFTLLVDDYWLADKTTQVCYFAGTVVGTIDVWVDDVIGFVTAEIENLEESQ